MKDPSYSVLEYRYRDAANYKVEGRVLLRGSATAEDLQAFRSKLDADDQFVAEQVGLPSLRPTAPCTSPGTPLFLLRA